LEAFVISVGTCGFAVAQSRAMRELEVVEIQRTFYRPVPVDLARQGGPENRIGSRVNAQESQGNPGLPRRGAKGKDGRCS